MSLMFASIVLVLTVIFKDSLQSSVIPTQGQRHSLEARQWSTPKPKPPKSNCFVSDAVPSLGKHTVTLSLFESEKWANACDEAFQQSISNVCDCTTGFLPIWIPGFSFEYMGVGRGGAREKVCRLIFVIDDLECVMTALNLERTGAREGALLPPGCGPGHG